MPLSSQEYDRRDRMDTALIRLYRSTRDPRRLDTLVERFAPIAKAEVRPYLQRGEPFDDLIQVANLGLLKALERFDPDTYSQGFGAFARPTISGEIRRHFRDHTWSVKVPRSLQELRQKLTRAHAQHPDASPAELAEHLGIPIEEVHEGELVDGAYRARSLDMPLGDDGAASVHDTLPSTEAGYREIELHDEVRTALDALGPRDREVVELRYYDELLQREIAERIGCSQMQVSRILARAEDLMRAQLRAPDAGDRRARTALPVGA